MVAGPTDPGVRLDNMGDALKTTPALAAIRHALPHAQLTPLTSPSGGALAPHLPFVDRTLTVRAPWVRQPEGTRSGDLAAFAGDIEVRRFDAAIVFTTYTQSALPAAMLALLARIRLRLAGAAPCRPCGHRVCPTAPDCATAVGVEDVLRCAEELLEPAHA